MLRSFRSFGAHWLLGALLIASCQSSSGHGVAQVSNAAQEAFFQARQLRDEGCSADDAALWNYLVKARRLAPQWLAPARFEDDLLSAELRSVEALERRRFESDDQPGSSGFKYLVARLEGARDPDVYGRLIRNSPDLAWSHHAFAWANSLSGNPTLSVNAWKRAIQLSRGSFDSAYFAVALARHLEEQDNSAEARGSLLWLLQHSTLRPEDHAWVESALALVELGGAEPWLQRVGYARGLRLLTENQLGRAHSYALTSVMLSSHSSDDVGAARLEAALLDREDDTGQILLTLLWLSRGELTNERTLSLSTGEWEMGELFDSPAALLTELRAKRYSQALDTWLLGMPPQVLAADGLPKDERLRTLVFAAKNARQIPPPVGRLMELTQCMLSAGWFEAAEIVADHLMAVDFKEGKPLRARALRGKALFRRLQHQLLDVARGQKDVEAAAGYEQGMAKQSDEIDDLLRRVGVAFAQAAQEPGKSVDPQAYREALAASPRMTFGPAATLVHPGPWFSAADERAGLGKQGDSVPGLARQMAEYGRFAVLGEALGAGIDGAVLRRVLVERREGQHLGVPWQGTIAWCDGVDVKSRAQSLDANVLGAAVHEGYWVDLAEAREGVERWNSSVDDFRGAADDPRAQRRLERAINTRGLRLRATAGQAGLRQRERIAGSPALSSSSRLRLVLLRERAQPGELLGHLSFGELVELTAVHEEGHLCDQTRFLPWTKHLPEIFAFALDQGFSATAIQIRLEYRAELIALCSLPDPRLALVQILDSAERSGPGTGLGHGPAYRDILADFLRTLDRQLSASPDEWPELDPEHMLVHQLHHLPGEKVRQIAIEVARREGLVQPGWNAGASQPPAR